VLHPRLDLGYASANSAFGSHTVNLDWVHFSLHCFLCSVFGHRLFGREVPECEERCGMTALSSARSILLRDGIRAAKPRTDLPILC